MPPRPKRLTRAEAKARTRELLLDAAAETFARKGYGGASVEEIAENAGYSIGALYSNFGGKEQLFLELLGTRATSRVAEAARVIDEKAVDRDAGVEAAFGGLGRLLVETADRDIAFESLHSEFWLYAVRNPEAMETLAARLSDTQDALGEVVESVLGRHGELPGRSVRPVATVVYALFHGLVQQRRIDPESVPEELFEHALTWLFSGLTRPPNG